MEDCEAFHAKTDDLTEEEYRKYMGYDLKLCVECRHIIRDAAKLHEYSRCNRPGGATIDLVDGHKTIVYCQVERTSVRTDRCGEAGQFHEKKT